jgi:hypothetical protein
MLFNICNHPVSLTIRSSLVNGSTRHYNSSFEIPGFFVVKGAGSGSLPLSDPAAEKGIKIKAKTINALIIL